MIYKFKFLKLEFNKRQLFYSIIAVLFVASLLTSYIKSQSLLNTNDWLIASNPGDRYYIKYPTEWKIKEGTGYLLSLVDPKTSMEISLREISDGNDDKVRRSIVERRNEQLKLTNKLPQGYLDFKETKIGGNTLFVVREFNTYFPEPGKNQDKPEFEDLGYDLAYIINDNKVAKFYSTKDFTDPKSTQVIKTIFSTFKYDGSLDGKNLSFQSKELKISFEYPSELYPVIEHPASNKLKSDGKFLDLSEDIEPERLIPLQEWWLIDFSRRTTFDSSYLQINAATSKGGPISWEGGPHWLNEKINAYDTAENVELKLIKGKFNVVKVQKVQSKKNITAFEAWVINCYGSCSLDRIYIFPIQIKNYNNILIYTVVKDIIDFDVNPFPGKEEIKRIAFLEIDNIEKKVSDGLTLKVIQNQNIIFNSLKFE